MPRSNLTHDDSYRGLPIRPDSHGNCLDILECTHRLMADMLSRHSRVFGGMLTLNFPRGTGYLPNNDHMIQFMDRFATYLNSRGIDYAYVWAREQAEPGAQHHYHLLLMLDGDKTWAFYGGHLETASRMWAEVVGVPKEGLVHLSEWDEAGDDRFPYVRNGGVMVRRSDPGFKEALGLLFERFSYVAKQSTKEGTPRNVRRFASSLVAGPVSPFPDSALAVRV